MISALCIVALIMAISFWGAWLATRLVRVQVTVNCVHNDEPDEDELGDTPEEPTPVITRADLGVN